MMSSDDDRTVQRTIEWPEEHAPRAAHARRAAHEPATRARTEALGQSERDARRALTSQQPTRALASTAPRAPSSQPPRALTKLHLASALGLGALLASASMLVLLPNGASHSLAPSRALAEPAPAPTPQAARVEPSPAATAVPPELTATAPADAARWTPSAAAAALALNEYEVALDAYRALASLHPQAPVYGVIAEVLARKLSARCEEGAPCRP